MQLILHFLPACCCDFIICLKKRVQHIVWNGRFISLFCLLFVVVAVVCPQYAKLLCDWPLVLFAECKRWNPLRSFAVFHHLLWFGLCSTYFNGLIYFVPDLSRILSLLFRWPCAHSLAVVTFYDALVAKQPFAVQGSRLLSIMDVHSSSMKAKWLFWEGLCQTPGGHRDKDIWPSMIMGFLYFLSSEIYLHIKWSTLFLSERNSIKNERPNLTITGSKLKMCLLIIYLFWLISNWHHQMVSSMEPFCSWICATSLGFHDKSEINQPLH